jgi:Mrp family chromosome partitioning ATPase
MGRMLETLKQESKPQTDPGVVDGALREPEEAPYIEVGAGKKVEGSPQVMAAKQPSQPPVHPPQPHVHPPHPPTEKNLAALSREPAASATGAPKGVQLTEPPPMSIAFEPWPALLVPSRGIAPEVIAFHQPNHAISQQYGALLGKILEGQNGSGTKAILLSGCKPNVGTTTALLNLAVVASVQDRRRVALVDAHLTRPKLALRLGLSVGLGLQEVVAGTAALEPAVMKTPVAGLYLVAARADDNATVGHVSSEAFAWLIGWLKERFDLVLIDGPGIEESAEIGTLAPLCDGMYLVVPQSDTAPPYRAMAQNIGRQGGHLRGLIHTHCEM